MESDVCITLLQAELKNTAQLTHFNARCELPGFQQQMLHNSQELQGASDENAMQSIVSAKRELL